MKNLNISVVDKIAKYLQRDGEIVCGNRDYQITFTFDAEWDVYPTKTARFIWNGQFWDEVFQGNICPVPILTNTTSVTVGVYAGDISTTTPAFITCKRSILCYDLEINDGCIDGLTDEAVYAAYRAEVAAARAEAAHPEAERVKLEAYVEKTAIELETHISAEMAEATSEIAKKTQLRPEFVNSVSECTDTTKMYVLPDNFLYAYIRGAVANYTNALKKATDSTGNAVYNNAGYKNGVRLTDLASTNPNGESANTNYTSTGFINYQLYSDTTVKYEPIYIKGLAWTNVGDTRMRWYRKLSTSANFTDVYGNMSISGSKLTDNGLYKIEKKVGESWVETTSADTGTYWRITPDGEAMAAALKAQHPGYNLGEIAYFRLSLEGKGENLIISIGKPIETIAQYDWNNTGHAFVPADYEDRIVENSQEIESLKSRVYLLETDNEDDSEVKDNTVGEAEGVLKYVQDEAERVSQNVYSHQNANTFSFLAVSDMHFSENWASIVESCMHAGQGMDLVRKGVNIDFAVFLGDATWGSSVQPVITTQEMGIAEIRQVNKYIEPAFRGIPNFRTIGNHDNLVYNYDTNGAYLSGDKLFPLFGAYNRGATYPANKAGGYCYRDFDEWNLRIICLNTTEDSANNPADKANIYSSPAQLQWFANTLDLSAKSNATKWSILIFSHTPLEMVSGTRMSKILEAYVNGTTFSDSTEGVTISYNYSGKNKATVIANIHGHNHNFQVDYIRKYVSSNTTTPISIKRICVPNACYMRSNERGQNGATDLWDIEYGETITYDKVRNTAQDTAFNVFTIDPVARKIFADCYGAGYDREINY